VRTVELAKNEGHSLGKVVYGPGHLAHGAIALGVSSLRPISIPSPSSSLQVSAGSSIFRGHLLSIDLRLEPSEIRHDYETRDIDQAYDKTASAAGNGAARR
jgi:hypothetical protein